VAYDKGQRLDEFFRRMEAASPAGDFGSAYELLCATLNEVENEMTDIPYNPDSWMRDGRLYPPQTDSMTDVKGFDGVRRFRSLNHLTYIAANGAIEIQQGRKVWGSVFKKAGIDGFHVWECKPSEE